ncbi:MAG: phage/plasmid primase, P4 family, partial [Verrucomicrobiota bacterium]
APPARGWDLVAWLARYLPGAEGPREWQGGRRWTLPVCPMDESHARGEAFVTEHAGGAISAGCHHDSCRWDWAALRAKLEPTPEARGLAALGGVREALAGLPQDVDDSDLVAALGPIYEALLAVPAGALRDAACGEVHRALRPRAKSLTLKGIRADVVRLARMKAGADAQPVALALGSDVEVAQHVLDDLERDGEPLVHDRGRLWRYGAGAGLWTRLEPHAVRSQVAELDGLLLRSSDAEGARPLKVGARMMRDVYTVALDRRARPDWFDAAPRGLAFANGYLVLDEGGRLALRPLGPEHRATVGYDWAYDPEAHPSRFYDVLCECWETDDDRDAKVDLLREWVGAALLGLATRYQRAAVLVGGGANGKSTILSIVQGLFPPDAVCAVNPQDMSDEYRRALLAGCRLNCVSELPEAEILQSESIKTLISGDPITAREIREAPFRFRPEAGHLFSANALPAVRDTSRGFWRRWIVLTFNREFAAAEQIRDLDRQVLEAEAPAIVSWALRGAEALVARGSYQETDEMRAACDEWQRTADPVTAFVTDRCEHVMGAAFAEGQGTPASILYDEYKTWAEREGHARMSSTTFGRRLSLLVRRRHTADGKVYALTLKVGAGLRLLRERHESF